MAIKRERHTFTMRDERGDCREYTVELTVDYGPLLERLTRKADRNRSRRTSALQGAIKLNVNSSLKREVK